MRFESPFSIGGSLSERKWFGKRDVCMALPPGMRGRFLTEAPAKA
jgi:hypothetical protein